MPNTYPYQDTSTPTLEGEQWVPIPLLELDGNYLVSNMGRVKTLTRKVAHKRMGLVTVKGKILKQGTIKNRNKQIGDDTLSLKICISIGGKVMEMLVRRLVYLSFIGPIDDQMNVINIDGDGLNNKVDNLKLVSIKQKTKLIYDKKRVISTNLKTADRTKWKNQHYGGYSRSKPVKKCDLNGRVIETYPSVRQAARANGISDKEVILVAKGHFKQWKGVIYQYMD